MYSCPVEMESYGGFPEKEPVVQGFRVFIVVILNELLGRILAGDLKRPTRI